MDPEGAGGRPVHAASFYRTVGDYSAAIDGFVQEGLDRHAAVFLAVPGDHLPAERAAARWPEITVADMRELGGNPARIIPALRAFAESHAGQRVCYLGESLWPGRGSAERREAARHEALLNLAFAGCDMSMLCLYNTAVLPESVVSDARASHPSLLSGATKRVNHDYRLGELPASLGKPLPAPAHARELSYERDLRPVRALVAAVGLEAGLPESRRADLVIAASEVAANTLRHTSGGGVIKLWIIPDDVLCQVEDSGHITDPLVGHVRPAADRPGGQGLWLVNQLCDLTEIRSSELGTAIRLWMHRDH